MPRIRHDPSQPMDDLFRAVLSLQNIDECYRFFGDLLTVQELASFAQRLQVARLLSEGNTYEMIRDQVAISSSTITRINTELRYGSGGYRMVLDRLFPAEQEGAGEPGPEGQP